MTTEWIIAGLFFATVFLTVEAIYHVFFKGARRRQKINRRLAIAGGQSSRQAVLEQLRRERGLFGTGDYDTKSWLQRLVVQSGLRVTAWRLASYFFVCSFLSFLAIGWFFGFSIVTALVAGTASCLLILGYIHQMRRRRINKFSEQLPEAIDIMVRSLRAGHPIPVSLNLVSEEMADPAGSEFGMASDEITYGSDLETALDNLYHRVGQEDLLLLVISVSIQASTGGNLSEILSKLSKVIRERFKMRRKVKALSAEGRVSAIGLSVLPLLLFGALHLIAPRFYGDVWGEPVILPGLVVAGILMVIGNFVVYKMVNFRY